MPVSHGVDSIIAASDLSTVVILTGLGFSSISISFRAHISVAANKIANFLSSVI